MDLSIALALCKHFEGLHRLGKDGLVYPYLCPAAVWTIGFGSTFYEDGRRVGSDDPPITVARAEQLLLWELINCWNAVGRLCPKFFAWGVMNGTWRPMNAVVDFTFNLGSGRLQTSTLRRKLEAQDWVGAAEQLMLWTRAGGRVLPGLVRRRAAERVLLPLA